MRRANKVKIAPNLVSAARSKHDTANVNEATRSEESALIATFPQLEPVNLVIPTEVLEITPLDKENVLTVVSDDLSRDSAEKLKSDKKQTDAKKPLLLRKAITKGKLAIEEVDRSRLTIKQLMYINPADGVKPPNASNKVQEEKEVDTPNPTVGNSGSGFNKRRHAGKWSLAETACFYRALNMLGTDFSLMEQCFSGRTRDELKRKFKKEEKKNPKLIDKYISNQIPFDKSQFMIEEPDEDSSGASSTTTSKESQKGKIKEKAVKKQVSVQEPNPNESDSNVVSIAKKSLKNNATESGVSTRGRKTASESRSGRKKGQPIGSNDLDAVEQGNPASMMDEPDEDSSGASKTGATGKESKVQKGKEKAVKKQVSVQEPNPNESDSDVVSYAKKSLKKNAAESGVSTRGRKTATQSRSGRKKGQPIGSNDQDAVEQDFVEVPGTANQAPYFAEANPAFVQAEPGPVV